MKTPEECRLVIESWLASRNNDKRAELMIDDFCRDFDNKCKLDLQDHIICAVAGTLAGLMDMLFLGIPHPSKNGVEGGWIDGKVRAWFDRFLPEDKIKELEQDAKVTYDATTNDKTVTRVEGLSAYYHRLLSLGHDPVLGWFVGVYDLLNGTMTYIDKNGIFSSQEMEIYTDRMAQQILEAVKKQYKHLLSDVNTSMGLPVPLMGLFNLLQFGKIGEDNLTVAEIVQGMYYQGYDFKHFISMSIPEMLLEILVRAAWFIRHGRSFRKLPLFSSRERNPKLDSMLFESFSYYVALNAGKVALTRNLCAINYQVLIRYTALLKSELDWQLLGGKAITRSNYIDSCIKERFNYQ